MKVGIVLGSIREGRMGEGVARWVNDLAQGRDTGVEYELVDLKEFNVPLLESPVIPGAANKQYDNGQVQAWSDKIDSFDGFIFVTPEYNHSVPGGFKNAFDALGSEWFGKAVAFVGYGASGGVRAIEAWRLIVSNFQMLQVRSALEINLFTDFSENGFAPADRRIEEAANLFTQVEAMLKKVHA